MSNLGLYLVRATEYCAETRNLIEDVINSIVHNTPYVSTETRTLMLQEALKCMGFSKEQLTAFAKGEIPTEYKIVPVEVVLRRYYRGYVRVPTDGGDKSVLREAHKMILEDQDKCLDPDPDMDIEEADILSVAPDWDGVQYE